MPNCADPSHAHGQSHGHSHAHEHGHEHGHTHAHGTTAAEKYGIDTFVYSRRRPFHPKKLQDLIAFLPVKNAQVAPRRALAAAQPPARLRARRARCLPVNNSGRGRWERSTSVEYRG